MAAAMPTGHGTSYSPAFPVLSSRPACAAELSRRAGAQRRRVQSSDWLGSHLKASNERIELLCELTLRGKWLSRIDIV